MTTSPTTLDIVVDEYLALKTEIDTRNSRLKELRDQILTTLPDGGTVGDHKVTVSRPKSVDWAKVEASFPADVYPQIYGQALDRDAVKNFVAPAVLNDYTTEGSPRVTVK